MSIVVPPLTAESGVQISAVTKASSHWDDYISRSPAGSPFHELAWLQAACDSYGHAPQNLMAVSEATGEVCGVLPLCLVRGPLTGRALVSSPYAVYGGVLADTPAAERELLDAAKRLADDLHVRYLEVRQGAPLDGFVNQCHYYTFRKRLPDRPEDVLGTFPRKARAAVRQAIDRHKLSTQFGPELLDTFYQLYVASLRRLASPAHSRRFLSRLLKNFGERCLVQVVYREQTPVAGVLSLCFQNQVLPYFAGIDERFSRLNTSNYLYYSLMEHAVRLGLNEFDFGRTRQDNEGGCQFKINQGFEPQPLHYAFFSPSGQYPPDLRPSNPRFSAARAVWQRLPLPVAARAGALVTRWLP